MQFLARTSWGLAAVVALIAVAWNEPGTVAAEPPRLINGVIDGRPVRGLSLVSAVNRRVVLGADGWIHDFDPRRVDNDLQDVEGHFQPFDVLAMRSQLYEEFGRGFEVVTTRHYLIVKPQGSSAQWPAIFEQLHRTFVGYFTSRGVQVRQGNFPMVAIVMPDEATMQQYLTGLGIKVSGVLGVYDRASNRIVMYDHGSSSGGVAATICHEAAHQSAFNTGVHSRFAETPHWIVEGIGCLFQSPAMIEGRRNGPREERIDPGLSRAYRATYLEQPKKLQADLQRLVQNDSAFRHSRTIADGYTLSWALTFYLSEREPAVFAKLVKAYADAEPLLSYGSEERLSDFIQLTGATPTELAARMDRFFLSQF